MMEALNVCCVSRAALRVARLEQSTKSVKRGVLSGRAACFGDYHFIPSSKEVINEAMWVMSIISVCVNDGFRKFKNGACQLGTQGDVSKVNVPVRWGT